MDSECSLTCPYCTSPSSSEPQVRGQRAPVTRIQCTPSTCRATSNGTDQWWVTAEKKQRNQKFLCCLAATCQARTSVHALQRWKRKMSIISELGDMSSWATSSRTGIVKRQGSLSSQAIWFSKSATIRGQITGSQTLLEFTSSLYSWQRTLNYVLSS